jgi:hypothetical protein
MASLSLVKYKHEAMEVAIPRSTDYFRGSVTRTFILVPSTGFAVTWAA